MNFDNFKEWLLMPSRNFTRLPAGTVDLGVTLKPVLKNCFENGIFEISITWGSVSTFFVHFRKNKNMVGNSKF